MQIAFYAPLKPVDGTKPSGDRQIARLLIETLKRLDHNVFIASTLRSWMAKPDINTQHHLARESEKEADRLIKIWKDDGCYPDLWLTYHVYYKAPDWLGPIIAKRLGIPYVIIEASRSQKRHNDAWYFGFEAVEKALQCADAVVAYHRADRAGLEAVVEQPRLMQLTPFIDATAFLQASEKNRQERLSQVQLLTVGMMRRGDKEASYFILADAMQRLDDCDWHLTIAGDGVMRETILSRFSQNRITYLGEVDYATLPILYANADLFVWPAIREAFGMVFLEAQAAGTPVVGGRTLGVPDVVRDGVSGLLTAEGNADDFSKAIRLLLDDSCLRKKMGQQAQDNIQKYHDMQAGMQTLDNILMQAVKNFQQKESV